MGLMKVYKSLRTRIQCGLRHGCGSGQNLRTDVDEYFGIRTSLVTMHAPWVVHTTAVMLYGIMMSQSPGTKHYVPLPGVSQEAVDTC